jgi:thioesterase domain-containing protein/acyl carrier protein
MRCWNDAMSQQKKIEAIYPLTPSQQGMLFETLAATGSGIHVEQAVCRLDGLLDVAAFEQAWQRIMDRHPVLRTAFAWKDQDQPLQAVLPRVKVPLRVEDWSGEDEAGRDTRLDRWLDADRAAGFVLTRAPLLRLALFRLGPAAHYFVWTFHHILMDGWCIPLIMKDVLAGYAAARASGHAGFAPVRPFRDYVNWLRRQASGAAEAYWRAALAGFRQATPLGIELDEPAPRLNGDPYGKVTARLSAGTTEALRELAGRRHLTLNTVVQGLWAAVLGAVSGQDDVLFGATVSGRPADLDGAETMVGPFFNTVPLRCTLAPNSGFADWLDRLQQRGVEQQGYEFCSAGQIYGWSEVGGSAPLYDSILVFENYPMEAARTAEGAPPALAIAEPRSIGARTGVPFTLICGPGRQLVLEAVHDRRRLDTADAEALLALLTGMAEQVAARPETALRDLRAAVPLDRRPRLRRPGTRTGAARAPFVPPRTSIELQLVALWEEMLKTSPIGVHDDFFTLGGHSLLVLRLMAEIEQRFGRKLPLAAIFEGSTVERLALALIQRLDPAAWSPLVPIQPRGGRVPLFCIHPLGGNVLCYGDLARHLGGDQPVYGLQAPGMIEGQAPLTSIAEMAETYLAALRRIQPAGPYRLAGYSFGGFVIFEMAQMLLARGEAVDLLVMLDTPNPVTVPDAIRFTDTAGLLVSLFSETLDLDVEALRRLSDDDQIALVFEAAKTAGLVPPQSGLPEARRYFEVCRINHRMALDARPYPGRIVLFRGEEGAQRITDDPALGWESLTLGGIEIHWIPGAHETMLSPPHVESVAVVLAGCLEAI